MAVGVEQAIAEILRDGDPARGISGLDALYDFRLYDDVDTSKRRINVAEEPDQPDEAVTIVIESGGPPLGGGDPNAVGRQPAFTVRTRSPLYARAAEIAHAIHAILDFYQGTAHGVPFFRVFAAFEPTPLGRDREDRGGRWIFTQSYRAIAKRFALT